MTADRWIEVTLRVAPADVEFVASVLTDATDQTVAIEPQIERFEEVDFGYTELDLPVTVRGYVEPPLTEARRKRIESTISSLELSSPINAPTYRELDPTDWSEEWKRFYDIQHIGTRMVIRPTWLEYEPAASEVVLELDPGSAFGTGQHETTRLCIAAIERHLGNSADVLDVGCGSGILAIAAAKLGAHQIRAVDTDPEAIQVTEENARANSVEGRIESAVGSLGAEWPWAASPEESANLVVANISSTIVLRMLPSIVTALTPGGRAILSGFLAEDAARIEAAVVSAGFAHLETQSDGDWACLVAALEADAS